MKITKIEGEEPANYWNLRKISGVYSFRKKHSDLRYIGYTEDLDRRCRWHLAPNAPSWRVWNHLDASDLVFCVLDVCSVHHAMLREAVYINILKTYLPQYGFNGTHFKFPSDGVRIRFPHWKKFTRREFIETREEISSRIHLRAPR